MNYEVGFLRAIQANPEDDAVRLIYADWLEENGSSPGSIARAELIRLQVDQARQFPLRRQDLADVGPDRAHRIIHLERTFYREWLGVLAEELITGHCSINERHSGWLNFHRGFPEELLTHKSPEGIASFLRWADELARICPTLQKVCFDLTVDASQEPNVTVPEAPGPLDLPMVQALARCPLLARLHTLELVHGALDAAGSEALVGSPYLTGLRHLTLKGNHLTAEGVRALLAPGRLPNLITLDLSCYGGPEYISYRPGVDGEGVRVLASSPLPPRLQELDLKGSHLEDAEIFALAASPHLEQLTNLDIGTIYGQAREALRQRFGARVTREDRTYAAKELGEAPDQAAVAPLIDLLKDSQAQVRRSAADALKSIGDFGILSGSETRLSLIAALKDTDAQVRRSAAAALRSMSVVRNEVPGAVAALIDALGDRDAEVRGLATEALGSMGESCGSTAKLAVPALINLINLLEDPTPFVRGKAAAALVAFAPSIRWAFEHFPPGSKTTRASRLWAETKAAVPALIAALKDTVVGQYISRGWWDDDLSPRR